MTPDQVRTEDVAGARIAVLAGEIDVLVAPHAAAHLRALVADAPALVLDLSAVTFFDSSGVRLLDELARVCAGGDVPWCVVAPTGGPSRRVLELVGMTGPEVVEDRAAALVRLAC